MAKVPLPKTENVDLPPDPGLLGGWGRKLETTLLRFALRMFNAVMGPFWDARDAVINHFLESKADEIRPLLLPYLDRIETIPGLPPEIRDSISQLRGTEPISMAAIGIAVVMAALYGVVSGLAQPFQRYISQEMDNLVRSARMSPSESFVSWKRGKLDYDGFLDNLKDGGWPDHLIEAWEEILRPLVGVGDLGTLLLREELSEGDFDDNLAKRGYTPEETTRVKALLQIIPPVADIIRMSVREAFTPDIVEAFQLHAELPPDMVEWAGKQGLSSDWAKAYWAAHWTLPPLTLGYRMLHREIIDADTMALLIKAHDVSPFWRDKLIDLSYDPYTRVDVRRMYATGVLKQEEVYRSYRDIGYNHEKATNLTSFTVALANATERELTKTDALYGYNIGYFTPDETDGLLKTLGYDQTECEFYRAKEDFKRWQKLVKDNIDTVKQQYIANQIEQAEVYAQLGALGLTGEEMNRYILEWDIKRSAKLKRLTAEKLSEFRVLEIINDDEFANEMSGLGYSNLYIGWYLDSLAIGG